VAAADDIDEDLSFLEQDDDKPTYSSDPEDSDDEADNYGDDFGSYNDSDSDEEEVFLADEKDVVVLRERNFTDVIEENKYVMVEFYAPWCGHCQALAPEYAAAATQLKDDGVDVVLAKVDATKEHQLARHYDVQGFPTILFFVDGEHKPYNGQRTKWGSLSLSLCLSVSLSLSLCVSLYLCVCVCSRVRCWCFKLLCGNITLGGWWVRKSFVIRHG